MANKELDDNPSENDIYFDSSKEIIGNSGRLEGIDEIVIDENTSGNSNHGDCESDSPSNNSILQQLVQLPTCYAWFSVP